MDYKTIANMRPEDYLYPARFKTENDHLSAAGYSENQYRKGLETGQGAAYIAISVCGTWSAMMKNGSSVQSYEGIGYHSCTDSLLQGFLDSGAPIVVFRWSGQHIKATWVVGPRPAPSPDKPFLAVIP